MYCKVKVLITQNCSIHYWNVITDALLSEQHFNVVMVELKLTSLYTRYYN